MVDGKKVNKSFVFISLMFFILLMSSFVLAEESKVTGKFEAVVDFVPGASAGIEKLSGASGESIGFKYHFRLFRLSESLEVCSASYKSP